MKNRAPKNERTNLKDIESGRFKDLYLVYNRKSTDEANNQKNSISYQKTENCKYAHSNGLLIAPVNVEGFSRDGVVSEKHSGFKEDDSLSFTESGLVQYRIERPKFQKLLQHLNKGAFKGIICLCWDRISRNKGDDTIIRKLMRRGVDVRFVFANYDKSSAGALHMDIDGMFSQHHSRVTSEKVTLTTKGNREKGICTYRAPMGYLNLGKMDDKPFDPIRAPIIKKMFEKYATGNWSLSDLARFANNQGMTTLPMRRRRTKEEMLDENFEIADVPKISRPINENHVSRILTNKFYTGRIMNGVGGYVMSVSHKALVSDNLFQLVQYMLSQKRVSIHYTDKLELPLRGKIRCTHCNRAYTPYLKKGFQYLNARCKKGCKNSKKNVNLKYITDGIGSILGNLYFTNEELSKLDARIHTGIALLEEKRDLEFCEIDWAKKKLREDVSFLRKNKLTLLKAGTYTPDEFVIEERRLHDELAALQTQELVSEEAMHETMKDIQKLSELLKNLCPLYNFMDFAQKEHAIRIIFSELHLSDEGLRYKVTRGIRCLENRFEAMCDPIAWLSELSNQRTLIQSMIKAMQQVVNLAKP